MKKLVRFGLFLVISVMLVACSGKSSGDGKKTLEVALWDENVSDAVDASIESFKKEHPDVNVKVTYTPFAEYWTKLRTSLGGGSGPDVFWMNGPNFYQYVTSDLIKDLEPFLEGDEEFAKENYYPAVVDLYSYEDKLYAAPYFVDSVGLFYNKKFFDEAGLDYPDETWTWEDIEKVGAELTKPEEGTYGYLNQVVRNQAGYYNLMHQAGGYVISEDKTKSGFNTPEAKETFEFLNRLIEKKISPTAQAQIETEADQWFMSQKVAMIPEISVHAAEYEEVLGEDLGVAPLPKGKVDTSIVHGIGWAMNSKTKDEDLAWELIKSLSNKEGTTVMAETGFATPAHMEISKVWLDSLPNVELQVFLDALEKATAYPISERTSEWQTVETTEIQGAFLGQKSIEEALEKIDKEMNAILEEEQKD